MNKREYCQKAFMYHQSGFNCTQSVLAAYQDRTGLSEQQSFAVATGFGGGVRYGGLCGAVSGAVMVLGILYPHDQKNDPEGKSASIRRTVEFERRFKERFANLDCRDLLASKELAGTDIAVELGATKHCDLLIVSATDLLYDYLEELKAQEKE